MVFPQSKLIGPWGARHPFVHERNGDATHRQAYYSIMWCYSIISSVAASSSPSRRLYKTLFIFSTLHTLPHIANGNHGKKTIIQISIGQNA